MAKPKNVIVSERKRWGFLGLPFTFTVYSITDKKLLIKRGLVNRSYDEILLYRVTDLQLKNTFAQTVFGLGLGTVTVYSKDTSDGTLEIRNIRHARNFYDCLSDNLEKERLRYGVRASELIGHEGDLGDHGFDSFDGSAF